MSLSPKYLDYLDHFGGTKPLAELARDSGPGIGLRHDVDHDLDFALDMAFHEHQRGCRATYFLLHTADYWDDPLLISKCRQLLDYGHEIGLHTDLFSEIAADPSVEAAARVEELLATLRTSGADVRGVAAHGAPQCYEYGYVNTWLWTDLRGSDPAHRERGLTAEGTVSEDPRFRIDYPVGGRLEFEDGREQPLWFLRMSDFGIEYEAIRIPVDHYWTDSGGDWTRSGDPLTTDLSSGRHQVLFHPIWWRGEARKIFVLSPARSGTKWLTSVIERASSARAVHEWTLNHVESDGDIQVDKRTDIFQDLLDDRSATLPLLREGLRLQRKQGSDRIEANVYLPFFIDELRQMEPDAEFLHLHRDSRDVVRSLLARDWYATPEDRRHPKIDVPQWDSSNQVERCCWYLRWVHEQIAPWATARIQFEQMVQDPEYLRSVLGELDVVLHPRLLEGVFSKVVDPTAEWHLPPFAEWDEDEQARFNKVCGIVQEALGYQDRADTIAAPPATGVDETFGECLVTLGALDLSGLGVLGVGLFLRGDALQCDILDQQPTNHLLLASGAWSRVERSQGFLVEPDRYYVCRIAGLLSEGRKVRVFALFYDADGKQIRRLQVHTWRPGVSEIKVSFSAALGASHCALGLHYGDQSAGPVHDLRAFEVHSFGFPTGYCFDRTQTGAADELEST